MAARRRRARVRVPAPRAARNRRRGALSAGGAAGSLADGGQPPRFELCIYADDVDRAAEDLARAGVDLLLPPTDQPWGERLFYVEDPDGNPIQVTAKIEAA